MLNSKIWGCTQEEYDTIKNLVRRKIENLRHITPRKKFDSKKIAEVEINKFFYQGSCIDRIMIVLRTSGCEHYRLTGGCSMCSHFNGTVDENITDEDYRLQWESIISGSAIETQERFDLNDYKVVCLYNLGSLLNEKEISPAAVQDIFKSLNSFHKVEKVIIESRAEYITHESISNIYNVYKRVVEVGIGVESTNIMIRELCHHKGIEDENIIVKAIKILNEGNCKALAYINFKPVFLTEKEAIEDAINTGVQCFEMGFDAISIEPTSIQEYSLTNYLREVGLYRVPWLWSVREVIKGIYDRMGADKKLDIRIGGYFDEEVLSGSQGASYDNRNEIFPIQNAFNCNVCSSELIEQIKQYNMTYDVKDLYKVKECPYCTETWTTALEIIDSRRLITRITDVLG